MKITVIDPRPIAPEEQARVIGLSSLMGHVLFEGLDAERLSAAFGNSDFAPLDAVLGTVRNGCMPGESFRPEGIDVTHIQRRMVVKGYGSILSAGRRVRSVEYDLCWEAREGTLNLTTVCCHPSRPAYEERRHG